MSEIKGIFLNLPKNVGAALAVIGNLYGIGEERKKKLEEDGYDYNTVQSCVNELLPIIQKYE